MFPRDFAGFSDAAYDRARPLVWALRRRLASTRSAKSSSDAAPHASRDAAAISANGLTSPSLTSAANDHSRTHVRSRRRTVTRPSDMNDTRVVQQASKGSAK